MDRGVEMVRQAWASGQQIITFGNGGSAMIALHYVTDWSKMIHLSTGRTLVDNMGHVFIEQLKNASQPFVVAISGSGNSENVTRAVDHADEIGCETLGLCGFDAAQSLRTA
jgi:D-sedoheptulose 7-phosphate isomerase